ncbi:AfsR/SARP family transcriptional regulator [Saccharothrix stipae]
MALSGTLSGGTMRFRLLGPLQLANETGWTGVPAAQQRLVLALLVIHAGRTVPTERLVDELWGERPPATATNTVQAYVLRLRKALGDQRGELLATRPGGYQLVADPGDIDVSAFERGVAEARQRLADREPARAAELLAAALALWRGPALADVPQTGLVAAEAARLERLRLMAVETHMATELRLGRHVDVVGELSRLVAEHPLAEALRGQLMLALYRSGRRADALETYRRGHAVLVEELGVEPTRELVDLYRAILDDDPELARDAQPEQMAVPGATPHQLPPDIPDFTGRAHHVRHVSDVLTGPGTATPVVAVTGRAGIGKTTLAVHVAHRLRESFPDGQLYVDLHGVDGDPRTGDDPVAPADPHDVLARFLTALGLDGRALPTGLEERAESLRSLLARRRVLVVLDNAADERQVRPLLPGTPSCAVLVTSRRRLTGLAATWVTMDQLSPDAALELLGRLVDPRRLAAEPVAAKAIVARCDHLPLAVRIAGARLANRPQWTLARLADRLDGAAGRLDELATGDLAVRTSLAASYTALEPGARRAFRVLGVLDAPDFAAWVPAALLDTDPAEAEARLDALVDAQLVVCTGAGPDGRLRYRLHDLVRLFARERAESEEPAEARAAALTRVLGGWLTLAAAADATLTERVASDVDGSAVRWPASAEDVDGDPIAWFDAEHTALVAGVEQAGRAGLAGHAWELATLAVNYFAFRGRYDDWWRTHELALRACAAAGDGFGAAVLTRSLCYLRMTGVRVPELDLVAALRAFRAAGDRRGEADLLGLMAFARRHDVERAVRDGDAAMAMAVASGYELGRCRLWYLRAIIHREQGRYREATDAAEECLALAQRVGTAHDRVLALWELAAACRDGQAALSIRDRLSAGIDQCRVRGERLLAAYLDLAAGELELRFELADPSPRLQRALALFYQHGVLLGQVMGLRLAGELSCRQGQAAVAVTQLTRAARLAAKIGNQRERAAALKVLGVAHQDVGATVTAVETWREALALLAALGDRTESAAVAALLGDVEPAIPGA